MTTNRVAASAAHSPAMTPSPDAVWRDLEACLFDLDGVFWLGETPLPGLERLFAWLAERALPYLLVSNNASRSSGDIVAKLARFGVSVAPEHVLTSSMATADYLRHSLPNGASIGVVGGPGLRTPLEAAGFRVVEDVSRPVAAVVVGLDRELSYDKLKVATLQLNGGAQLVATNVDANYPTPEGLLPGAGAIVAALATASGQRPLVIGKPEPILFEMALERLGCRPERAVMVGDRLDTDILGANRAGLRSVLLTTGVDQVADIGRLGIRPSAVYSGLSALVDAATAAT